MGLEYGGTDLGVSASRSDKPHGVTGKTINSLWLRVAFQQNLTSMKEALT